jgi:hypothetical protein
MAVRMSSRFSSVSPGGVTVSFGEIDNALEASLKFESESDAAHSV